MIRAALVVLLLSPGGVSPKLSCSHQDVLDHLNLTMSNEVFRLTRPVLDHTRPTEIELKLVLFSILAMIEKTQTFVPFLWAHMTWTNERIHWDPAQFCGISHITVPREMLWMPDLFIYEMTEKDSSPRNPFVVAYHNGTVMSEEDMRVVSSCRMCMHKFPFDTQSCSLTVGSAIHTVDEMILRSSFDSTRITEFTKEVLWSQGEWEFKHLAVGNRNFSYGGREWDTLVYTFTMKRRPLLHVLNLLVPIMFFLILDLASFFVADHRGEKLGFKVTVLLAISVLLLILNDILPSTSNHTPLIATYCIVIFGLMLLSVLETILVTFLLDMSQKKRPTHKRRNSTT
uniref:Si:dkey-49c17.4 n=1 Tax=Neogobius melanostomus TaxID=47308 RepID=A0A8C6WW62_9GOBI